MNAIDTGGYIDRRNTFADCAAFSSELVKCHLNWNVVPIRAKEYHASISLREFDEVVFAEVEHDPIWGERRDNDIRGRDHNVVGLTLFTHGVVEFQRAGREIILQSHELLLWDGARPSQIRSWDTVACKTLLFPRALVRLQVGNIDELVGRRLGLDSGAGQLLEAHVEALHDTFGMIAPKDRPSVLRATLDLIGACFRHSDDSPKGTKYRKALFRRVEEHMRDHLLDPQLSPDAVASAFGFSPRYLHRLFADAGMTYSAWIRRERLSRAEKALLSESFAADSITEIAHRFGFCDSAHFSNQFKARYGMPPRAYRAAAQAPLRIESDAN